MGLRPPSAAAGVAGAQVEYSPLADEEAGGGGGDRKPHGGRWLLWLPVLVSAAVLYALNINSELHFHGPRPGRLAPMSVEVPELPRHSNSFLVDSAGCRMPALDPWDPMVREFITKQKPINCSANYGLPLVASNATFLFVVEEALPFYNISDVVDLSCCYQPFHRVQKGDDAIKKETNCTVFQGEVSVEDEFVQVKCFVEELMVYEDFHAFVPRKAAVEERCRNASFASPSFEGSAPSVLLLGIDAVSRLNLHRQMPLTVALLRRMGAVEMLGFNKVGDNTFPNLVPALTGLDVEQLRNNCWTTDDTFFDECPFVWNDYRDAGFRTGFGEDAPWMGIFNYIKKGFNKQPTDYYLRPFMRTIEDKIGHTKHLNAKLCVGPRLTAQVLLQYVSKFSRTFKKDRYFALFWGASLSHDFLNYPSLGDDMYADFLSRLRDEGALERTVVAVMSDHGIRWGSIRNTYQGRMEERLPFLFLLFPGWFKERFPAAVANAERNARRLSTPFDLFETLRDLTRPEGRLAEEAVRRRSAAVAAAGKESPPRGVSLFLPLPPDRTCAQAGIDPHWCTCQQSQPVEREDEIVNRTADYLVGHINDIVRPFRQCSQLELAEIKDVQLEVPQKDLHKDIKDPGVHDYVLVVRTEPGDAIFEGTVRHTPKSDNLTMAGFVSRLNLYGSQSACVSNYHLKLYCYCSS